MDDKALTMKPCPFCGCGKPVVEDQALDVDCPVYCVECPCCDAHGPVVGSEMLAVKLWNARGL